VIKKEQISTHSRFTNPIWNVNPQFKDIELYDFSILSGNSPAVGSSLGGIYQLLTDIKGVFRQNPATIGAYEFQ
jgi:Tol biopolymer transport system component